jgi:hypothetical protein
MYNTRHTGILGNRLTEGTIRIDDKLNKHNKIDRRTRRWYSY